MNASEFRVLSDVMLCEELHNFDMNTHHLASLLLGVTKKGLALCWEHSISRNCLQSTTIKNNQTCTEKKDFLPLTMLTATPKRQSIRRLARFIKNSLSKMRSLLGQQKRSLQWTLDLKKSLYFWTRTITFESERRYSQPEDVFFSPNMASNFKPFLTT